MRTTVKGTKGPNLLVGSAAGTTFRFVADGTFAAGSHGRLAGDPGHPGLNVPFDTGGVAYSQDVYQGVAGAHNVLKMGEGHQAILLSSSGTKAAIPGPRLINIDEIRAGSGGQIVDLTTETYTYGNVKIIGGSGDDLLAGNAGNDVIKGGLGTDGIWGGSGNDTLSGGAGNDIVMGADGNDKVDGGAGDDMVGGFSGNDTVAGGAGADQVYGGDGDDVLTGAAGKDTIFGEAGADRLNGGLDDDLLEGGEGNDRLTGGDGSDSLDGGAGDDSLNGGVGDDDLLGGAGNDTLFGGDGADSIDGGDGNDAIYDAAGTSKVLGGTGNDTIEVGMAAAPVVSPWGFIDAVDGGDGNDLIKSGTSIQRLMALGGYGNDTLLGSSGDDSMFGDAGNDQLFGGLGNNLLAGGDGNDSLTGQGGNNTLIGGAGHDTISTAWRSGKDVVGLSLDGGGGDQISGFSQHDGDRLQVRLSDFNLSTAYELSANSGETLVAGDGLAVVTYGTTADTDGQYTISNISMTADGLLIVDGAVTATTSTADHAQFIYAASGAGGDLWFDADGSGSGAAVHIANLSTLDFTGEHALKSSDFLLQNS
jgi:Ca2+-binding RTX toxin-like protein